MVAYRGSDLQLLAHIPLDLEPDAEEYDPATHRLYVGYGGEDAHKTYGEVGIIDAISDKHVGDIRTSAHPGAILVGQPGRTIYITVPTFGGCTQLFVNVDNLFNRDLVLVSPIVQPFLYPPVNYADYDTLGRVYRAGIRLRF